MSERRQTRRPEDERQREANHAPPQPPGWDEVDWDTWTPGANVPPPRPRAGPDLAPLFALLDFVRSALPRELRDQFTSLLREVLLTLRALIDWYLERLGGEPSGPAVEDIPIE
jgi:hypothetical protein